MATKGYAVIVVWIPVCNCWSWFFSVNRTPTKGDAPDVLSAVLKSISLTTHTLGKREITTFPTLRFLRKHAPSLDVGDTNSYVIPSATIGDPFATPTFWARWCHLHPSTASPWYMRFLLGGRWRQTDSLPQCWCFNGRRGFFVRSWRCICSS